MLNRKDVNRMAMKEYDYSKLRGKIKEVFRTESDFAVAMLMSTVTLSAKLNNKISWTQAEMNLACDLLSVPYEFIPVLFFTEKVKSS